MAKPAPLSSGLAVKKGEAASVSPVSAPVPEVSRPTGKRTLGTNKPDPAPGKEREYFKALTVKLDRERYMELKQLGLLRDQSSQDLLVEALDAFLKKASTQ